MEITTLENSSNSVENTDNKHSSELAKYEEIANSPFRAVSIISEKEKEEERKYFLTLGQYRLTEQEYTLEELEKMVEEKPWELILGVMTVHTEYINKLKSSENGN